MPGPFILPERTFLTRDGKAVRESDAAGMADAATVLGGAGLEVPAEEAERLGLAGLFPEGAGVPPPAAEPDPEEAEAAAKAVEAPPATRAVRGADTK